MTHLTGVHDDNTQVSEYTPTLPLEPKPNAYPSRTLNLTLGSFSKGEGETGQKARLLLIFVVPFAPQELATFSRSKSCCTSAANTTSKKRKKPRKTRMPRTKTKTRRRPVRQINPRTVVTRASQSLASRSSPWARRLGPRWHSGLSTTW